ncbi:MAG: tRNA preQ1(34) S-adenosylmethionine ribosyltransferase-isomerase QueA [Candidatus Omnitrophica bacterium]|nr:tRNA preQ1(34) S-adenosylmethionine ribosyltransferase-isomerase QueA [Candidatus Omnitrophota bacterium]
MNLNSFDYPLPKDLIAQSPAKKRDDSRLLVVDRKTGSLEDRHFSDLADYVPAGDVLALNDTKVFPARLLGNKKGTGGKVDVLLLGPSGPNAWRCLVQPALREGQEIVFPFAGAEAFFLKRGADGIPVLEFKHVPDVRVFAERHGTMPLPPYIKREAGKEDDADYQTVYAAKCGAVAAPTAGLHFTEDLIRRLIAKGVTVLYVTLHVGYGTFRPVEDLEDHRMHAEYFELSKESAEGINQGRSEGKRVWTVGETCVQAKRLIPGRGETDLFIKEPFEFEIAGRLITNFHLPKTTLLLLVSAFMGESLRRKAYEHAIREKYRFYSYGDAMLIL